jgi:hypothetical protein
VTPLLGIQDSTTAARERPVLAPKASRIIDAEVRRLRIGVSKIQEPTGSEGVGCANLRRAAPDPILIREAERLRAGRGDQLPADYGIRGPGKLRLDADSAGPPPA